MGLGASIFVIGVGAILAFAVTAEVGGVDVGPAGWILMIVGAVGVVLSLVFWSTWGGPFSFGSRPPEPGEAPPGGG